MKPRRLISIFAVLLLVLLGFFSVQYVHYRYPLEYKELIAQYSAEYGVDEYLVMSMINAESRYKENAASSQGALGLMQITEPTAAWIAKTMGDKDFDVEELYDPETNIKMGTWYIGNLKKAFGDDELALAAYNAGRGNVSAWLQDPEISPDGTSLDKIPFKETEKYIKKVIEDIKIYKLLY
jgi:soluble lytic murein transglycosylase